MTVPSYTEDLTDIADGDEASGWVEMTGTDQDAEVYNAQGAPAYEDDEFPYIQGLYAVTQDTTKSTAIGSLAWPLVSPITIPTDGAVFVWHNYSSPFAFGSYATGGFRILLGSGLADFDVWYTGGNDKDSYPYGGFVNHVINDTVTRDNFAGTFSGTINYVGSAVWVLAGPGKGEPHQCDVMRYGRGSAIFEFGEAADYCIIPGYAIQNDDQANRWGLIQAVPGGYQWKGRMQLGTVTNAVDFRDSNRNIFIQWTPKVTANFNLIEVINSDSNVEMTGFTFQVLDTTTAAKGRFLMTDPATVVLTSCNFIDMDSFVFNYSVNTVDILSCNFTRCGLVTQGGALFDGCLFTEPTGAVGSLVDDLDSIDNCEFVSDGTGHAMELTSDHIQGGEYTLEGCTYSGYAAVSGSTGNETIYNNSGNFVTINIVDGDSPSIMDGVGASTKLVQAVTYTLTGVVSGSEIQIVTQDAYDDGSVSADEDLYHLENTTIDDGSGRGTTQATYTYSYTGDTPIFVYLHKLGYEWTRILDTLISTNKSVPVSQKIDRVYDNPN